MLLSVISIAGFSFSLFSRRSNIEIMYSGTISVQIMLTTLWHSQLERTIRNARIAYDSKPVPRAVYEDIPPVTS